MHGDPTIDPNSDRGNLGFMRVCHPDTRRVFFPMAYHPMLAQAPEDGFFQPFDISTYAADVLCQPEDRIHHKLPRSVIRYGSATVDVLNFYSIDVQ